MSKDWTIDTYVLYKAADVDYDAVEFLNRILRERHWVAFDHKRHIEKEYQDCLINAQRERKGGSEALKRWFKTVVAKYAQKYSGELQERHQRGLEKMKFDRSDWPFVAVCSRTESKNLVSEDSDYTEGVKNYLQSKMSISVLSIQGSLEVQKHGNE
jgi:hypothetical protein